MNAFRDPSSVAEFEGVYGPYVVSELLLQKIWDQRLFRCEEVFAADGRKLSIEYPGRWNRLAGPDFQDARLRLDGKLIHGDVEIHFHARDWHNHGHDSNPDYRRVVLHVVLFPPDEKTPPLINRDQEEIPVLVLLPLLWHDLEQYAWDDEAGLAAGGDADRGLREALLAMSREERVQSLFDRGRLRWEQKTEFLRRKVDRLGWRKACHLSALEILGYRMNRSAMLMLGECYPLEEWSRQSTGVETLLRDPRVSSLWAKGGQRPANQPLVRLRQYREWVRQNPDWPDTLKSLSEEWSSLTPPSPPVVPGGSPARTFRQAFKLRPWLQEANRKLGVDVLTGPRLFTLWGDGFLPLLGAAGAKNLFPLWFFLYPGDVPVILRLVLREIEITGTGADVMCHGYLQGLYALALERDLLR